MPIEDISALWAQVNPMRDDIQQLKAVQNEHSRRLDEYARMSSEQHAEIKTLLRANSDDSKAHYKAIIDDLTKVKNDQALREGKWQGIKVAIGWIIVVVPSVMAGVWVVGRAIN